MHLRLRSDNLYDGSTIQQNIYVVKKLAKIEAKLKFNYAAKKITEAKSLR